MIINTGYTMVPALKKLWKEGFGDEDRYIDLFFSKRFKPENTFAYMEKGFPVSIASVLEASLYHNGTFIPAWYIYGVTTSSSYRGKGYGTAVIEHINKMYPAAFLVPSSEDLIAFYIRRGFLPAFSMKELVFHGNDLNIKEKNIKSETVFPDEYKNIRDSCFTKNGYICWDAQAIAYALEENSLLGGCALKVQLNDKKKSNGIILYRIQNNELFVSETTLPLPVLRDTVCMLMKQRGVCVCRVRCQTGKANPGRPFGLLRSDITIRNGYCNLVLD